MLRYEKSRFQTDLAIAASLGGRLFAERVRDENIILIRKITEKTGGEGAGAEWVTGN